MLHNIPYVTPVIGAIRIGHMEERNGKRLPQKDDHFTITEQYKQLGQWVRHPLHDALLARQQPNDGKLREIPVRVLYADADLNVTARYEAYDTGAYGIVCAGDGDKARRLKSDGAFEEVACPGERYCAFGSKFRCGIFGRALFRIEGQNPGLGAFVMRTGSYNGVTTLRAQLTGLSQLVGEQLPHIPLKLVLRAKSSPMSLGATFYYADLELGGNLEDLVQEATQAVVNQKSMGIDVAAYERAMLALRGNGGFEDPTETFEDREEFHVTGTTEVGEVAGGNGSDEPLVGKPGDTAPVKPATLARKPVRDTELPPGIDEVMQDKPIAQGLPENLVDICVL